MLTAKLVVNIGSECGKSRFRSEVLDFKNFRGRIPSDPPLIVAPLSRIASVMRNTSHIYNELDPPNFNHLPMPLCKTSNLLQMPSKLSNISQTTGNSAEKRAMKITVHALLGFQTYKKNVHPPLQPLPQTKILDPPLVQILDAGLYRDFKSLVH